MGSSTKPAQRVFGLQDVVVLISALSLISIQMVDFAIDPGVGWHLATGEYILKHESIPRFDPFLATSTPRPWIADQWLADLVLFSLYAFGSWPLLYGAMGAIYLATFYLILYPLTVRTIGAPVLAIGATLLAFKLGQIHFILRPVVFGLGCFAFLAAVVWRREIARRSPAMLRTPRWPLEVVIAPLFVLWANLHPSFVLGILFLALRPIALILDRVVRASPTLDRPALRFAWRDLGWATVASCVNPYGLALHRSIIDLGTDPYFMNLHEEWLPPDLSSGVGLTLLVTLVLFCLSCALERAPRSYRSFELLVCLTFSGLALSAVRIIPFFAIAMVVPLARTLANHTLIVPASSGLRWRLCEAWSAISSREMNSARGVVSASLLCFLILADPLLRGAVLFFSGPFGPPQERFPYAAVRLLADAATPTTPIVVAAPPEWGGFITGFGGEFVHPIIDDRNTLLGADFYRSFDNAMRPLGDWAGYLAEQGASYLLLPASHLLTTEVKTSPSFDLIFGDSVGVLYKRRPDENLLAERSAGNIPEAALYTVLPLRTRDE